MRALVAAFLVCGAAAVPARADIYLYLTTRVVRAGAVVRGIGDGSGLPVFIVPADRAPSRYSCRPRTICEPTSKRRPGAPFVYFGRMNRSAPFYVNRPFGFRIPPGTRPGLYRLFVYCRACGGSLIQSGRRIEGETFRVVPSSSSVGTSSAGSCKGP